jgi:hypothetical protein
MKHKTWNIGEYAKGGVIQTIVTDDTLTIIMKDWDHKAGDLITSDQSNAKEWDRKVVSLKLNASNNPYNEAYEYLVDQTTHYYAEQILDWAGLKFHTHSTY